MSDIVEQLRQGALTRDDYRWVAADEIERLRAALEWIAGCSLSLPQAMADKARAALEGK